MVARFVHIPINYCAHSHKTSSKTCKVSPDGDVQRKYLKVVNVGTIQESYGRGAERRPDFVGLAQSRVPKLASEHAKTVRDAR